MLQLDDRTIIDLYGIAWAVSSHHVGASDVEEIASQVVTRIVEMLDEPTCRVVDHAHPPSVRTNRPT